MDTWLEMDARSLTRACHDTVVTIGPPVPIFGLALHLIGGVHPDEGEIVITGPQLAQGYWNDPVRTAEVFRPVRLAGGVETRGYYTSNWAERINGRLFSWERHGRQVKAQGFRVELGEIEAASIAGAWSNGSHNR